VKYTREKREYENSYARSSSNNPLKKSSEEFSKNKSTARSKSNKNKVVSNKYSSINTTKNKFRVSITETDNFDQNGIIK